MPVMESVEWMRDGACRGGSVDVWFPEQPDFRDAREVCRRCRVRVECLDYAVRRPEVFGVWGGTSPTERVEIRRRRIAGS